MQRRKFIGTASAGAALGALAAPSIVSAQPAVRWRLASSFPKSLDTIYGASEILARRVGQLTNGKFQISVHAAGEIVPGLQVLDAVQGGTVEACHTTLYYFFGKDPTWALASAVPFGLNCRQFNAWWHHGGGDKVFNEFAAKTGVHAILAGNTGAQMGGWFRKEINTVEDLKGLKFRVGGFAGQVLTRLGVVPQQLAGGDVYPALEKGTIDAAEWVGPYDDEKLGFNKVAKYYYYPGWWEGGPALHTVVNQKALAALPADYRAALEAACEEANVWMVSKYDAVNPPALKRLVAGGALLRPFSRPIMEASYKASQEVYADTAAKNPEFRRLHDHYFGFQRDQITWFRVCENTFDDFMASSRR
ncbi:MAG TPA: TRAP transporter substrate-binding protein [Burkholderiaceae bacterium]|nr:TRAP transporter substrate-binding protein [Burkholderiaceae bacterium]